MLYSVVLRSKHLLLTGLLLFALLIASSISSCNEAAGNKPVSGKNSKMAGVLTGVQKKIYSFQNHFCAEAKLEHIDSLIQATPDHAEQLNLAFSKGNILLEYGDEAAAVQIYEQLYKVVDSTSNSRARVLMELGMAYTRLAERTNCVTNHSAEACIMPIQGSGVHQDKNPARKAVEAFTALLKLDPYSLDARWLLNINYMTLGEYPKGVPKKWLIPGLDDPGPYRVKPFSDIAGNLGLAVTNRAGGTVVDDFDNDGYLDVIMSAWGLDDPMHYFRNNGDGSFTDLSEESGLAAIGGGLNLTHVDYNNDGWLDIFVLRGGWQGQSGFGDQPNSLLRNNGDGTFTDVTIEAGMLSFHPTQTATWNDFNKDGWVDVFIGNETVDAGVPHPCELYINNQDGTFTNMATPELLNVVGFIKGVASGDYDNDGWPDLFFSSINGVKLLLHNKGVPGKQVLFEDMTEKAGFSHESYRSFPTWFFDYDNDGWLDLFVCNYEFNRALSYYAAKEVLEPSGDQAGKPCLYHNNHDGTFTNVTAQMNLNKVAFSMGSNFGDIDNDGWLDFYLATGNPDYKSLVPNKMFKNLGGKKFADVTVSARVGNLQKGHGVAFADMDNDGDQDIYVDMGGAFKGDAYASSFYLNPGQNNNNWINMKVEGTTSNRAGIGAKIVVRFYENGQERAVYRDLNAGGSFGNSPFRREIGIGQATMIDEISITWPVTGKTQTLKNVQPNQFIKVKEGKEGFETVALKKLNFPTGDRSMPMCVPAK